MKILVKKSRVTVAEFSNHKQNCCVSRSLNCKIINNIANKTDNKKHLHLFLSTACWLVENSTLGRSDKRPSKIIQTTLQKCLDTDMEW